VTAEEPTYCGACMKKDPPVEKLLKVGENILKSRWDRGYYICDECMHEKQAIYRHKGKEKFAQYLQELHDETVEEFVQQWADPAYAKIKEIADRVYKVFDKYDRREPKKGIRTDWILEVIFPDLWGGDAVKMLEEYYDRNHMKQGERIAAQVHLLKFMGDQVHAPMLLEGFRNHARNRWSSIIDTIARKYADIDKMVAKPSWEDPTIKEAVPNWYLLSKRKQLENREQSREALKLSLDRITKQEGTIIEHRELIEKKQEAKQPKDSNSSSGTGDAVANGNEEDQKND